MGSLKSVESLIKEDLSNLLNNPRDVGRRFVFRSRGIGYEGWIDLINQVNSESVTHKIRLIQFNPACSPTLVLLVT